MAHIVTVFTLLFVATVAFLAVVAVRIGIAEMVEFLLFTNKEKGRWKAV